MSDTFFAPPLLLARCRHDPLRHADIAVHCSELGSLASGSIPTSTARRTHIATRTPSSVFSFQPSNPDELERFPPRSQVFPLRVSEIFERTTRGPLHLVSGSSTPAHPQARGKITEGGNAIKNKDQKEKIHNGLNLETTKTEI